MKKLTLFLMIVLMAASCKKGEDGKDGNANVITLTYTGEVFDYRAFPYSLELSNPYITQNVIDKGLISVSANVGYGWFMLPSNDPAIDVSYSLEKITLWADTIQLPMSVKVTVIPSN